MLPLIPIVLAGSGLAAYLYMKANPKVQVLKSTTPKGTPVTVIAPVVTKTSTVPNTTPHLDPTHPAVVTPTGASNLTVQSIQDVQRALNTLGVAKPPLAADGILGPLSVTALKTFQSGQGLTPTGAADSATKDALSKALTNVAATKADVGVEAMKNPLTSTQAQAAGGTSTIQQAQHVLNVLGATPPLTEDGKAGPETVAATKAFQAVHGLVIDGVIGPNTIAALQHAVTAGPAVVTGAMPEAQPTEHGDLMAATENPL